MGSIQKYFDTCVSYWVREHGLSIGAAMVRAIWWDCVEVWNIDKSWNKEKIDFINQYRKYKPYDPIPEERLVEEGKV